jgi:hypothetical protein
MLFPEGISASTRVMDEASILHILLDIDIQKKGIYVDINSVHHCLPERTLVL